jgi:hypothetical protein
MPRIVKFLIIAAAVVIVGAIILTAPTPSLIIGDYTGPVGCLREINTAEITYQATFPKTGFSPNLWSLGGSTAADFQPNEQNAGLVDSNLRSGLKSGYRFTVSVTRDEKSGLNVAYAAHADPDPGLKYEIEPRNLWERIFPPKLRHYYTDQSGIIRYERGREANANSPML